MLSVILVMFHFSRVLKMDWGKTQQPTKSKEEEWTTDQMDRVKNQDPTHT